MNANLQVHTDVEVRVRFRSGKVFPSNVAFDIIEPQAAREAVEKIKVLLTSEWQIVGEPTVQCVTAQRELLQST